MSDEVKDPTPFPNSNNNRPIKTAKTILAEIEGEAKASAAKEFKSKLVEKISERNKLSESLDALNIQIKKMSDEYEEKLNKV